MLIRRKYHRPGREWCLLTNYNSDGTLDMPYATAPSFTTYTRTSGRSFSIWFKVPVLPPDGEFLPIFCVGGADSTGTDGYWWVAVRTNSTINGGDTNTYVSLNSIIQNSLSRVGWWKTTPLVADTWYHLVVWTTGSSWGARINNVAQATTMTTNSNNGFWFGDNGIAATRMGVLGGSFIGGAFNNSATDKRLYTWQLTLWDKQLTSGEITSLYNGGLGMNPRFHSAVANITDYWPLGEIDDIDASVLVNPVIGSTTWTAGNMSNVHNRALAA